MRKVVLFALAVVLVMGLTFGAQEGTVEMLQEKGVVTVGEAVPFTFTLSMGYKDVATRVIEVTGDTVDDNVFVMLLQDGSSGAVYQAKKEVYPTEQRTVYYISAAELTGQKVNLVVVMRDWNGKVVGEEKVEVSWMEELEIHTVNLYPEAEGIYSVMAWVELADGTRMSMPKAGQLIALKAYMEAGQWSHITPVQSIPNYFLQVKTGVELFVKFDEDGGVSEEPPMHLGVYGTGQRGIPSITWSVKGTQPTYGDLVLVINEVGAAAADANGNFTGYIKYKLYSELAEGDCCSVTPAEKWGVWISLGTGQIHSLYGSGWAQCNMAYHNLGIDNRFSWGWIVQKGRISTGFIKAEIFFNTGDFHFVITPVIGTYAKETGLFGSGEWDNPNDAQTGTYHSNLMQNMEFNLFVDLTFKKAIKINFGAWNNFEVIGLGMSTNIGSLNLGGALRLQATETTSTGSWEAETIDWAAHARLLNVSLYNFLPFDPIDTMSLGVFVKGSADADFSNFAVDSVTVMADLGAALKISCCEPVYPVKLAFMLGLDANDAVELRAIWGQYNYSLGSVGPVSLQASLGAIYSFVDTVSVDKGPYGQGYFKGPALGVAWQVTGRMEW